MVSRLITVVALQAAVAFAVYAVVWGSALSGAPVGATHWLALVGLAVLALLLASAEAVWRSQRDLAGRLGAAERERDQTEEARRHEQARRRDEAMEARRQRVRRSLAEPGLLEIVYQPIRDTRDGRLAGVESLSRFHLTPPQPPDAWFAEAWAVGLGVELEIGVAQRAIAEAAPERIGYLSLNFSPRTVTSDEFFAFLRTIARPLHSVVIELTEHAVVDEYGALTDALAKARTLGVRVAVDDAGAGYASFQHILELRPDFIKLDRSIVRDIDRDPGRRYLASALVAFAADIGAKVIAEGVEQIEELDMIRAVGVPLVQGYLLGRPGRPSVGLPPFPQPLARRSALVVDDDPVVVELVSTVLRKGGWTVSGRAADGADALEQAGRLQPDLILLDLQLAGRSGLDILPELHRAHPSTTIIVMSVGGSGEAVSGGGAHYFQSKHRLIEELPILLAVIATHPPPPHPTVGPELLEARRGSA